MSIWGKATDVGLLVLKVASCDALFCAQIIGVLREEQRMEYIHVSQKDTVTQPGPISLGCSQGKRPTPQEERLS